MPGTTQYFKLKSQTSDSISNILRARSGFLILLCSGVICDPKTRQVHSGQNWSAKLKY